MDWKTISGCFMISVVPLISSPQKACKSATQGDIPIKPIGICNKFQEGASHPQKSYKDVCENNNTEVHRQYFNNIDCNGAAAYSTIPAGWFANQGYGLDCGSPICDANDIAMYEHWSVCANKRTNDSTMTTEGLLGNWCMQTANFFPASEYGFNASFSVSLSGSCAVGYGGLELIGWAQPNCQGNVTNNVPVDNYCFEALGKGKTSNVLSCPITEAPTANPTAPNATAPTAKPTAAPTAKPTTASPTTEDSASSKTILSGIIIILVTAIGYFFM